MARSEHNREAYRSLFGYVGAAVQLLAITLIVISFPVAPSWVVLVLLIATVGGCAWSWRSFQRNFMMPTFVGLAGSCAWVLVIGLGAAILGWGP